MVQVLVPSLCGALNSKQAIVGRIAEIKQRGTSRITINRPDSRLPRSRFRVLGHRLSIRPLYLDCQVAPRLRHSTYNVGYSAGAAGKVPAITMGASVVVLVAGDAAKTKVIQDLLSDVLFENGGLG